MNSSEMLYAMCHEVLSTADIKAICKNRGFSEREANSRSLFESVFLSATGIEVAMKSLTRAEIATLHLLHMENSAVDVALFERLYGTKRTGSQAYGTFTQQFKPIYDAVQRGLIRKGLLIINETKTNSPTKTKMELWRYYFPPEFGQYLPSLFESTIHADQPGVVQVDRFRRELGRLLQTGSANSLKSSDVQLVGGSIVVGKRTFKAKFAQEWQQETWEADILQAGLKKLGTMIIAQPPTMHQGYLLAKNEYHKETPLPAILYALSKLTPDEWINPEELTPFLNVVYGSVDHPAAAAICQMGWKNSCLARYHADDVDYYRLIADRPPSASASPDSYLPVDNGGDRGALFVDLETIPYDVLEYLNRIVNLKVENGRLKVVASISKMVDSFDALRTHELVRYLQKHDTHFRAAFKKITDQWGKLIVHENLLVARITDLSLRVKLQKAFEPSDEASSPNLVILQDEYVAFPRAMLGEVEKLVKKAGHVIKTVQAR